PRRVPSARRLSLAEQAPEHELEDPAVAEVLALARRVEPKARAELLAVGAHGHLVGFPALEAEDPELLAAGQPQRLRGLARHELERRDPHHQEVRAVDPFVRVRYRGAHAQQVRPLRRPVARRAGAVLLAGDDDGRYSLAAVALGHLVDRALLAVGQVHGP